MSDDLLSSIVPQAPSRRASLSVRGRVVIYRLSGPFDADLVESLERGIVLLARQGPGDGRFVELIEFRVSVHMTTAARQRMRQLIDALSARFARAMASVFVAHPSVQAFDELPALLDIWRPTRRVSVVESEAEAWLELNRELSAAGLPTQIPPSPPPPPMAKAPERP